MITPGPWLPSQTRLIAAAPDLLAALEAAENAGTLDPTLRNPHHHRLHDEVIRQRRAAIAKAKGE